MPDLFYVPLKEWANLNEWGIVGLMPESLQDVLVSPSFLNSDGDMCVGVILLNEVLLQLPGFDFLKLALGATGTTELTVTIKFMPFSISLSAPITLRVDANILRPLKQGTDEPDSDAKTFDIDVGMVALKLNGNGEFDINLTSVVSIPRCMIDGTGLILEIGRLQWITPSTDPSTLPQNVPSNFTGVFFDDVTVCLPQLPVNNLRMDDVFLDTGGFSGHVSAQWTPQLAPDKKSFIGDGAGTLFDIPYTLKEIAIEFKQNTLVESKIEGAIILPFFEQPALCEIRLTNDGDFTVALSAFSSYQNLPSDFPAPTPSDDGLLVFTKEDLIKLKLKSIQFKREEELFEIQLGGDIKPLFGDIDWPEVEVKALTIDSKGHVRIDGGWIEIPKQKSLKFHGFQLELTRIGFGRENDGSRWIGMSGGFIIVEGIPLRGGVEGLKIIWKDVNDIRLEISGINVAFEIEDVLKFDGIVYFINEPTKKGFKGGVKLIIYPLNGMMIDGQFIAGRNTRSPAFNFFYNYVAVELPVGIPIGNTSLAIFGMAGLFGYNMKPDKRDNEAWFENDNGSAGFYKRPEIGITSVDKWTDLREALAFGAGLTLGTASDNGYTFSGKVLLIVSIPGPLILIEGKAQFLKERGSLNDDPIFRSLGVIDGKAGTFLMNVEAKYKYPENGRVIDVTGGSEAYFSVNNPNAWHFYLGQDTPEAKRIRARILNLFNANSYFMMDARGVVMGAWAGYGKSWKFGPLRVIIEAWIEAVLGISWKPPQIAGAMTLHGDVELKAFGKGIGLTVVASLAAKTPTPWYVCGKFKVKLNLPWPLPDPKATVELKWESPSEPPWPLPLSKVGIEHLKVTEKWELEKHIKYDTDDDGFVNVWNPSPTESEPCIDSPIVPLDARPVLTFARPVDDMTEMGHPIGVNSQSASPNDKVGDFEYKYSLKKITLRRQMKSATNSSWVDVANSDVPAVGHDGSLPGPIYGSWQLVTGSANGQSVTPSNVKLMLWTNTPFAISRELESNAVWLISIADQLARLDYKIPTQYPCALSREAAKNCNNFEDLAKDSEFSPFLLNDEFLYIAKKESIVIVEISAMQYGYENALTVKGGDKLTIVLPEEMVQVYLYFTKDSAGKIILLNKDNDIVNNATITFDNPAQPLLLAPGNLFKAIEIEGKFKLFMVCAVAEEEYLRVTQNDVVSSYIKDAIVETWDEHSAPLLEPNCYYELVIKTEVKRRKNGDSWDTKDFTENYYFQTANPPGAYPPQNVTVNTPSEEEPNEYGKIEHYPYGGPLKDPSIYIDFTIPKQVASNEPQTPVYRSYDVGVKFNEPSGFVEQMYLMAGLPLTIRLFDNNEQPLLDVNGNEVILENRWSKNTELAHTREEIQWRSYLKAGSCEYETEEMRNANSETLYSGSKNLNLKPQTLYKARLFAGGYSIYQFSFITSRFSCFVHHIHSFVDAVWDHHKLTVVPGSLLASSGLAELRNILSGFTERSQHEPQNPENQNTKLESEKFIELMNIFNLGARQLPVNLEILLLNDATRSYGLLLESPEPLDWERIEMGAKYSSSAEVIEESASSIKIIRANISAQSDVGDDYNKEWIEILLREQFDVSGLKIVHKKLSDTDFSDYYQFGDEGVLPTGTLIRIHSGKTADHSNSSVEIEERYRLTETDTGAWQFDAQGEIIQLVDATGKIIHNRPFIPYGNDGKNFIIVRNKDQTRAFIFFPHGTQKFSNLSDGRYCFGFKFKRKIGNKPTLKRMGLEDDEETFIEFSLPTSLPE